MQACTHSGDPVGVTAESTPLNLINVQGEQPQGRITKRPHVVLLLLRCPFCGDDRSDDCLAGLSCTAAAMVVIAAASHLFAADARNYQKVHRADTSELLRCDSGAITVLLLPA